MNKRESVRSFVELMKLHGYPTTDILAKYIAMQDSLSEDYAKDVTYDDVYSATHTPSNGHSPLTRKPRSNPLKRGTIMEFVSCVANEGKRFSPEDRQFAINALSREWQG